MYCKVYKVYARVYNKCMVKYKKCTKCMLECTVESEKIANLQVKVGGLRLGLATIAQDKNFFLCCPSELGVRFAYHRKKFVILHDGCQP